MESQKKSTEPKAKTAERPNLTVKSVILHSAIIIDGRTETTINTTKIPTIKSIEWTHNGFLVIVANQTHVLPGAAVKDSIL